MRLLWEGVVNSFEYTSINYLSALDGESSNKNLEAWKVNLSNRLLAHNNHAEAPFAVAKWLTKGFQSIRLDTTSGMVSEKKKADRDLSD